jgi:hypothetical protein
MYNPQRFVEIRPELALKQLLEVTGLSAIFNVAKY